MANNESRLEEDKETNLDEDYDEMGPLERLAAEHRKRQMSKKTGSATKSGKANGTNMQAEEVSDSTLRIYRKKILTNHPIRKFIEAAYLAYQIEQGAYPRKWPDRVRNRSNELSQEAFEYVYWYIRKKLPIDLQVLALDFLIHGQHPKVLNLEHTGLTSAIEALIFNAKAFRVINLLVVLQSKKLEVVECINRMDHDFRILEMDVGNFKYLLWNFFPEDGSLVAGYLGSLATEIKRKRVVFSPIEEPIPWETFTFGFDAEPLETFGPFMRYRTGFTDVISEIVNLGITRLDKDKFKSYLEVILSSALDTSHSSLRRGNRAAAFKMLKPLKEVADLAGKFELNLFAKGYGPYGILQG